MSSVHQLYTLINGGTGPLFVKLFTRFFHSLWTFTRHEPTAQQHLESSAFTSSATSLLTSPTSRPTRKVWPTYTDSSSVSHIKGDAMDSCPLLNIWKELS